MTSLRECPAYPAGEIIECPYPFYQAIRDEAPVYPVPGRPEDFIVSRHEDCLWVLKNPELFSSWVEPPGSDDPEIQAIADEGYDWVPLIHNNDPPSHHFYRSVAAKAFTPRRLRTYEPLIRSISQELIDGFADRPVVDFVAEYASKLPMLVIVDILGLPRDLLGSYKRWSDDFAEIQAKFGDKERRMELQRSLVEYQLFLAEQIRDRQRNPTDDVLSEIAHTTEDQGFPLQMSHLVGIVGVLLTAGNETTIYLLSNGLHQLLEHPAEAAKVRADQALIPAMLEEVLRRETSSQFSMRIAMKDVQRHGVTIPQGARVLVMRAAGNRDERKFAEPDTFRIDRPRVKDHLSFGNGIHFCLGAPLSRLEGTIAFQDLFRTFAAISPAEGRNTFEHIPHPFFRGLKELWIETKRA
jgi:cytochrome P450